MKRKRNLLLFFLVCFCSIALYSGYRLFQEHDLEQTAMQNFTSLEEEIRQRAMASAAQKLTDGEAAKQTNKDMEYNSSDEAHSGVDSSTTDDNSSATDNRFSENQTTPGSRSDSKLEVPTPLPPVEVYGFLKDQNPDFVAWLSITDTSISYPVMYTPDEPEYYLSHDFERRENPYGVPFLDADCTPDEPTAPLIVYGHNIKETSMFGALTAYRDPAYLQAHPQISYTTLTEYRTYEILLVFSTNARTGAANTFDYTTLLSCDTADAFADFWSECLHYALYDTGKTADYGDSLLLLSTCDHTEKNGRLVLLARQTTDIPEDAAK